MTKSRIGLLHLLWNDDKYALYATNGDYLESIDRDQAVHDDEATYRDYVFSTPDGISFTFSAEDVEEYARIRVSKIKESEEQTNE